jgi:hypothetical protein
MVCLHYTGMQRTTVTDAGVSPMEVTIFLCVTLEFVVQL